MSDPIDEVMKKVKPQLSADEITVSKTEVKQKKEKLFNNKYYRTVNIDVTAEEQRAKAAQEKILAAEKKKKEDEEAAQRKEDLKKVLQGMGFGVK